MTQPDKSCPAPELLKQLIESALPEDQQVALRAHIDDCTACQARLESMVAGSESWDSALGNLRGTEPIAEDSVLSDAMKQLKADGVDGLNPVGPAPTSLDFLAPSDHPGSLGRLGAYEVTEVIGQGGMGVVLKAFDPSLHRVVAVKVLAPYLSHNPLARKRFAGEAKAIAAVSHDHVITIHAIDESEEQPRIVMQYVCGQSLQQKIDAQGSLELKEILRIGMQTASGLAAAHAQGLVHRDVKPSNILLENGVQRVRLTDFGLARAVDDASMTQSGVIAGTPQYMAPEQANGETVDFRADLFSLGSVLYAMCVGYSPFRASTTMGVLKRVCHDAPRPIQEQNPDIPDWLCQIVMKLLSKKPEDRFPNAKVVADLLEKWLAYVQQPNIVARPPEINVNPTTTRADSSTNIAEPKTPVPMAYQAVENIDARTIFFQPVSAKLIVFLTLTGMALTITWARLYGGNPQMFETLIISIVPGLAFCMVSLMCIAVYRHFRANLWGKRATVGVHHFTPSHPETMIPPETIAMLTAIGCLVLSGNILLAAIVAIVIWRVLTSRGPVNVAQTSPEVSNETTTAPPSATSSNSRIKAILTALDKCARIAFDSAFSWLRRWFANLKPETLRTPLAIAWSLVGAISILAPFGFWIRNSSWLNCLAISIFGTLYVAIAHSLIVRQNSRFVKIASFLGLIPLRADIWLQVPLSVLTLVWLYRPETEAIFDQRPWSETYLGAFTAFLRRCGVTTLLLGFWTVSFLAALFILVAYVATPYMPAEYRIYDEARATVKGTTQPIELFITAIGSGRIDGLMPGSTTYPRRDLRIRVRGPAGNRELHALLFDKSAIDARTGESLTDSQMESLLPVSDERFELQSKNLVGMVYELKQLVAQKQSPAIPLREPDFRERLELYSEATKRGLDADNSDQQLHNNPDVSLNSGYPIKFSTDKPAGFQTLSSMLNPQLFQVTQNSGWFSAICLIPQSSTLLRVLSCFSVWLGVSLLIIWSRHFRRRANLKQSGNAS